jgi:hypothetical protein
MADITKCCNNENCPNRNSCYRVLVQDDKYQSWANFEYTCNENNGFEYYIPVDDRK